MFRLVKFLKRYYVVFLFIVLEGIAVNYYVNSTGYTRAKVYKVSSRITGSVDLFFTHIGDYFRLKKKNDELVDALASARNELEGYRSAEAFLPVEHAENSYFYSTAKVVTNSVNRQRNYFTLNKGFVDGVEDNMAVLSAAGDVAGYVLDRSERFAVCMSILNVDFRAGGRIKNKNYVGSISWDGLNPRYVTLSDIPRYASVEKGDTIVSAYSTRYPKDCYIGVVENLKKSDDNAYFEIRVRLGVNMYALSDVMLIKYTDSQEIDSLIEDQTSKEKQNQDPK